MSPSKTSLKPLFTFPRSALFVLIMGAFGAACTADSTPPVDSQAEAPAAAEQPAAPRAAAPADREEESGAADAKPESPKAASKKSAPRRLRRRTPNRLQDRLNREMAPSKPKSFGAVGRGSGAGAPAMSQTGRHDRRALPLVPVPPGVVAPPAANVPPEAMFFKHYGVNPTIDTAEQSKSTFSVDVDTASYTMVRRLLGLSQLPAEAAVRVEEFVNAFDYGYASPDDDVFAVQAEAGPSPNRKGYHVLHVGLQGQQLEAVGRKASNLVFVVDVSGSMRMGNRLGLVKRSLTMLTNQMRPGDTIGIVKYGSRAERVLAPTGIEARGRILSAIHSLDIEGATNAEAGLRLGYQMAASSLKPEGNNRVVLCSDGVANVGATGAGGILETVRQHAKRGITISTVGFGMGNYNDVLMEKLAQGGDGNYHYVDRIDQAKRVFVENLGSTLQVIAKDVKVQVSFDPAAVERYRLIGYENRALADRDFSNDRVDAGEIGAGHAVTALYEVKLRPGHDGPLGTVRVRYKAPKGQVSKLIERSLRRDIVRSQTERMSSPTQLSLVAAQFAEKLRGSYWVRNLSYEDVLARAEGLDEAMRSNADVAELIRLIRDAARLDQRSDKFEGRQPLATMSFDKVPVLR